MAQTLGSACLCCNSVVGPSQAATDSNCAWACWALLPSRGQRECFETIREFIWNLVQVFSIPSTSFLPFHSQNCTTWTPKVWGSRLPRSRLATANVPGHSVQPESEQGQDPRGRQGCGRQIRVSVAQSSRNTRPGIPDTLESSSKGRIPFLQFQVGSWTRGKRQERVRAHTFRVPQKFPGCKGTSPGVFNCLASCWGCRRPLANTYSTPAPPLYQCALPSADLK